MDRKFYDEKVFLVNESSNAIYKEIKNMPIIDYHCHLQPKEIYEDKPFDNIGEIWLGGDHYKWRLMRGVGIKEKYITGDSTWKEKFLNFASALELSLGNPLYHWSHMELKQFFGINVPLSSENAEEIWDKANAVIKETKMSVLAAHVQPQTKPIPHKKASIILHEWQRLAIKYCENKNLISFSAPIRIDDSTSLGVEKPKATRQGTEPPSCTLLQYYTPKTFEFQVFLGVITIFVNYAHFYVNIIM